MKFFVNIEEEIQYFTPTPFFFLMIRRPPRSTQQPTLFPYTTLFRSGARVHAAFRAAAERIAPQGPDRSEEHTSELQSPVVISYAVFCLKKKKEGLPRLQPRRTGRGNKKENAEEGY